MLYLILFATGVISSIRMTVVFSCFLMTKETGLFWIISRNVFGPFPGSPDGFSYLSSQK